MKLVRYGQIGHEKPGCLDSQGKIRDLSHVIPDINGEVLASTVWKELPKIKTDELPFAPENSRVGACVNHVGKLIGIGLNYADHAAETGAMTPTEPVVFLKATSCINGPYDPIIIPYGSTCTDWEVELGVVIAKSAKHIKPERALDYVAGYCVIDDVSERQFQLRTTGQWAKGKSCDSFGPIGPWLVTRDEITDPQNLSLWLEVDGVRYQNGQSNNMIFTVAQLVSYLSRFFTLHPGDIIATGTPAGVGLAQKPDPIYLKPGQTVRLGISGLGEQLHSVAAEIIA